VASGYVIVLVLKWSPGFFDFTRWQSPTASWRKGGPPWDFTGISQTKKEDFTNENRGFHKFKLEFGIWKWVIFQKKKLFDRENDDLNDKPPLFGCLMFFLFFLGTVSSDKPMKHMFAEIRSIHCCGKLMKHQKMAMSWENHGKTMRYDC